MSAVRRMRDWCSARRRWQFCLTVVVVALLTAVCGGLLLLPGLRGARPAPPAAADEAMGADARLDEVRRIVEPFGSLVVRRVATSGQQPSLIVGHPAQRAVVDTLARELSPAVASVTDVWGPNWARSALVVVASSPSEFAALLRSGALLPREVAAASIADPFAAGTQPTGQRVVFGPDAGTRLDPAGLANLLRHELTHVAARAETVDGAPLWMLEGFADYVAHHTQGHGFADAAPTLTAHIRAHDLPDNLPTDADFSGPDAAQTYEKAWSICAFIADKYDQPHLVQLYRRVAAGTQNAAGEDRAIRETLGTTRANLIDDWRSWLRAQTN